LPGSAGGRLGYALPKNCLGFNEGYSRVTIMKAYLVLYRNGELLLQMDLIELLLSLRHSRRCLHASIL
jgi:hypothetical protein